MYDDLIFDSHAHYDDHSFDEDRDRVLTGLISGGVGYVVNASARMDDMPKILELTKQYDFLYGSAGLHPTELAELNDTNLSEIKEMLQNPKIIAVGEIGLDYHYEDTDKSLQKAWFAAQISLAKEEGYPIMIHSRDAAADTLDLVKTENARDAGGVVHCFSYEKEMAKLYMDMGFYIGVGGVVTFKNARKLKEIAEYMPLDMMLLETDCPYLAPVPFRGKRNDSTMIKYVVDEISALKGIDREEVICVTTANSKRMYGID